MSTEIISSVNELKELNRQLKLMKSEMSKLNKRKKDLEKIVGDYLDKKDQPGLKYKDITIIAEDKDRYDRLKKAEKMEKGIEILEKYGIRNKEALLKELFHIKGDAKHIKTIKIKNNTQV
jgi:hypothetical protein